MKKNIDIGKGTRGYVLIVALFYLVYGMMQIYNGLAAGIIPGLRGNLQIGFPAFGSYIPNAFPDVFSGIVLIVVGGILIKAMYMSYLGDEKFYGYFFVAWLLAMILMILNVLVVLADMLDIYYPLLWGASIDEGWSLAGDMWGIAPHIILGILLIMFYPRMKWVVRELSSVRYKTSLSRNKE